MCARMFHSCFPCCILKMGPHSSSPGLPSVCRNQSERTGYRATPPTVIFILVLGGCACLHSWSLSFRAPLEVPTLCFNANSKPFFSLEFYFLFFIFTDLLTSHASGLRESLCIYFSFYFLPRRCHGASVEGSYSAVASRWLE